MSHIGLSLTDNEHGIPDLHLESDGSLAVVTNAEAVGQHVKQRLKTFEGEWFLDTAAGVPWLSEIMGRAFDATLAETVMKSEILETNGVTAINAFSVRFDRERRNLEGFNIDVETEYDVEVSV